MALYTKLIETTLKIVDNNGNENQIPKDDLRFKFSVDGLTVFISDVRLNKTYSCLVADLKDIDTGLVGNKNAVELYLAERTGGSSGGGETDLTTVETSLTSIITELQGIDTNTDDVENHLLNVISEIQNNGTVSHSDLLNIITELQGIDSNTDNLEAQLTSVISTLQNIENTTSISNTNEGLIRGEIQNTNTALGTLEDDVEALYDKTTSSTVTAVSVGVGATILLSSSATRKKAVIENNGNNTIYVKLGAIASTTDFSFKLAKDEIWEELNYQGIITAVTSSGTSSVNVTSM